MRLAILEKLGGVYVDVDFMCFRNIEALTSKLYQDIDFVCGISATQCIEINNALLLSKPETTFIKKLCKEIAISFLERKKKIDSANQFIKQMAAFTGEAPKEIKFTKEDIIASTGPGLITRVLYENFSEKVLAVPREVFYPLENVRRNEDSLEETVERLKEEFKEAVGCHLWMGQWI